MIDLRNRNLPNCIKMDGVTYPLNTDFRIWLDFSSLIKKQLDEIDLRVYFKKLAPKENWFEVYLKLADFYHNPNSTPNNEGSSSIAEKLVDFIEDGEYIYSSFLASYGIDLLKTELHWHTFLALFRSLPDDSKIKQIMGFRSYVKSKKTQDQLMSNAKRVWSFEKEYSFDKEKVMQEINKEFFGC